MVRYYIELLHPFNPQISVGEDFDQRIMEYFIKLIKRKHSKDVSNEKKAVQKLRREAERAKRSLSNQHQVRVEIESLYDGIDFSEPLTRARFEELNNDLFLKTMGPVKKAMEDWRIPDCDQKAKEQLSQVTTISR